MKNHRRKVVVFLAGILGVSLFICNLSFVKAADNKCSASYTEKNYIDKIKKYSQTSTFATI